MYVGRTIRSIPVTPLQLSQCRLRQEKTTLHEIRLSPTQLWLRLMINPASRQGIPASKKSNNYNIKIIPNKAGKYEKSTNQHIFFSS